MEKVSIPWRGQSDDFGHGGELIFRARASPCNMLLCATCCATCCTGLRRILVHFYTNEKISETQMRKSQRRSHRRAGKFIMYSFPYKFENVNPLTFLDRFGILVRFSVFVRHYSIFLHRRGWGQGPINLSILIGPWMGISRTHRARNLKELVRKEAGEHCTGAKVRVTLFNGGDDGFQQNVYGDLITVERNISLRASSGATYRLLDSHGVCRSTSKKDLDSMLDQLNIQVENPVAVLDQEEAKKFLTGKAQDKYQFFAKATELERMDRSYANVVDNITELEENKKKVQDSLQSKVDMVRKLKKEWEEYQILEKLQDKVLDYRVDYGWAFYQTVQEELNEEVTETTTVYTQSGKSVKPN